MRILFLAMALAFSTAAAAQGMYKCKDDAGKITYSGKECNLLGLSSAGEVTGRITVQPALKSPAPAPRPPAAQDTPKTQAKTEQPKEPERRCFTVKTGKGTATRCNDVPAEDAKETK